MAKFRIKQGSKQKAQAGLKKAVSVRKNNLAKVLGMWMDEVIGEMQDELLRVDAYDTGQTAAATVRDPVRQEGTKLKSKGHNDTEQAPVIEWGRLPGGRWPPAQSLVGWGVRKGLLKALSVNADLDQYREEWATACAITRNMWISKTGGGKTKKSEAIDPIVRDLVILRLIQKKIATRGTEGRHPFSRAWDRKGATARQDMAELLRLLE